MKITKKVFISLLAFTLICAATGCSRDNKSPAPIETVGAAGAEKDLAEENGIAPTETPDTKPETTEEPTTEEAATEEPTTEEPKEIVPAYYEEQPDIPTVDSITGVSLGGMSALGPMENGKYLEIRYRYDTEIDGKDCTEEVISGYTAFVAEQGFSVQEITSADEYAALNAKHHHNKNEDEKEIYHILNGTELAAVLSYNEEFQSLYIYLMDAYKPGNKPAEQNVPKDTAYKSGTVYMAAYKKEPYSVYDFTFTDGELTAQTFEDDNGKGGYSEDSGIGVEYSKFYGMTVEEISEMLEGEGYKITIGDDLYDVMMRSISD